MVIVSDNVAVSDNNNCKLCVTEVVYEINFLTIMFSASLQYSVKFINLSPHRSNVQIGLFPLLNWLVG